MSKILVAYASRCGSTAEVDLRDWPRIRTWADQLFQGAADANVAPA